jgi:hypothetical protein
MDKENQKPKLRSQTQITLRPSDNNGYVLTIWDGEEDGIFTCASFDDAIEKMARRLGEK